MFRLSLFEQPYLMARLINFFVTRETSFLVESDVRNYADIRISSYNRTIARPFV